MRSVAGARSWLFVPATTPHRFTTAASSGADAVVVDLEDAVGVAAKESARENMTAWLGGAGEAWVRVNGFGTPWHQADVSTLAALPGVHGLVVPKAEDAATLAELAGRLAPHQGLVPLIETARGVQRVDQIAQAPGVVRLAFGSLDFAADIRGDHDDRTLLLARSSIVLASRAARLPAPIDGVTTAVNDPAMVEADAHRARGLGFGGKLCIHPAQLEPVARAFAPSPEELAWARTVIAAAERAEGAVVGPDGHMIDQPVIDRATAILGLGSPSSATTALGTRTREGSPRRRRT